MLCLFYQIFLMLEEEKKGQTRQWKQLQHRPSGSRPLSDSSALALSQEPSEGGRSTGCGLGMALTAGPGNEEES